MTWQPELDELKRRQAGAQLMGGPEQVARHKANGKLTVRERIAALCDAGSFKEIGSVSGFAAYDPNNVLTSFTPTNQIIGRAAIDQRTVAISADDFTVRGGANDGGVREKLVYVEKMANQLRIPLVRLVDGTGGGGSVKTIEVIGRAYVPEVHGWEYAVMNLATVPVVGLALGSVAGLGAARVASSHYSLMVEGISQIFAAGPPVVASDPYHYGGGWTARASEKLVRFVDMAQTFHLPVVHLVDIPGFQIGVEAEEAATIRYGARAMAAVYQATVPWCSIIVRRAFGVAGAAHQSTGRFNIRYAWPSGEWGSRPIAGGLEAAYKGELEASADPAAKLAEIEARLKQVTSPFRTAEQFLIEEIIDPRQTRGLQCEFANLAAPLRTAGQSAFGMRP